MFDICFKNKIPILMVLSGGYLKKNSKIIADSIINLYNKFEMISSRVDENRFI